MTWPVALKSSDRTMEKRVELLLWLVVTDPKAPRTVNIAWIFSTAKPPPEPPESPAALEEASPPASPPPAPPGICPSTGELAGHGASIPHRVYADRKGMCQPAQPAHPVPGHPSALCESTVYPRELRNPTLPSEAAACRAALPPASPVTRAGAKALPQAPEPFE